MYVASPVRFQIVCLGPLGQRIPEEADSEFAVLRPSSPSRPVSFLALQQALHVIDSVPKIFAAELREWGTTQVFDDTAK